MELFTSFSEEFLESYKTKTPNWGFGNVGYITYKRTYARDMENGKTEEWPDTLKRCIEGAQKIGANYTQQEAERLFDLMFNLKCLYAGRMLWQLGTTTVDRFGANSLLNCLSGDTKVLTRQGWKEISSLENTEAEIVTKNGKWVSAKFYSYGIQELYEITFKSKYGQTQIHKATPNHRWFILNENNSHTETTTEKLLPNQKVPVVRGKNASKKLSPQGIQHGLVFGDGSCNGYESTIDLIGDTLKYCKKYFSTNEYVIIDNEDYHIRVTDLPNYYKQLPDINENKKYLSGFLAGWIAADGSVNKYCGTLRLFNKSKEILEKARDIAAVLGYRTSFPYLERDHNPYNSEDKTSELWSISFYRRDNAHHLLIRQDHIEKYGSLEERDYDNWMKVESVVPTGKTEKVYCAEVPDTHSFVIEGNILTGNCWGLAIKDTSDFCFLFENLMLGGGVGFSVKREDVHELPKIKRDVKISHLPTKDADFIVPDSREGWVKLLKHTLDAHFHTGESFTYSTILVRGRGEKIRGFGGSASGPKILNDGMEKICKVLKSREGKKLRSIDVLDICNIIGSIVVAGNVRRSAEISIGDPDDFLFLRAKRWDLGNIPNWRAMSNNTIGADSYEQISESVWEGYQGNGEPYGFFNLPLSQKYGRLGEEKKDNCIVLNPCGEITLSDHECCNLSEIFLNNIESKEELIDCAKLLYKTQKAICKMPFIHKETNAIVHKNMRIGLGISGICQAPEKIDWLDPAYRELKSFDKEYSKLHKLPESIKLTTIKPSGTISLLAGSTPGVHPGFARFYIRRIRISSNDPIVSLLKDMNYNLEYTKNFDGTENRDTIVAEFPCEYDEKTILSKNMSAIEQLELVKKIQTVWSDNAISVTVYYKKEELKEIQTWMKENYENSIKSVSFLLHSDHGFAQAPYEEIDEKKYFAMKSKLRAPTKYVEITPSDMVDSECENGVCPIK